VVHRPSDEATRLLALDYRCRPLAARHEHGELSYTLRYGIEMIAARGPAQEKDAILICLADQPMLRLDVIRSLIDAWKAGGASVVRPSYREAPGEPGHPLLIDRSLWVHAAEMRGESGFAPVIESRRILVKTISVAGRNPDVDTAADLEALAAAAEVGEH
jgi:CTP:molybdopterin cytidylyltransferase MocA